MDGSSVKRASKSVQFYEEALGWLFLNEEADIMRAVVEDGAALPVSACLILDIYWISEAKLRRDLARFWYPDRFGSRQGGL